MNVFLTGHGFIATALKNHLEKRGHIVYQPDRARLYDKAYLGTYFETHLTDIIIHTAAYGNMTSQSAPYDTVLANIVALHNLLEASKNTPYVAFINFSSSSVLLPIQTLYSTTKSMGETLASYYAQEKPIVNVRPYSVTGIGEQKEHLIPTLIDAACTGHEVPFVRGAKHDFIDILS